MRLVDDGTLGTALAAALVTAGLAGCGAADVVRGCSAADDRLVEELSATAWTGNDGPGDLEVDRVEVGKTVTVELPDDLRRFGADRLLASRAIAFDANPPSEDFAGVYFDAFVAVSPDDELVAPLGKATRVGFDVAAPDDPSWEKWAEEVMDSSQADRARSCVDPKA